MPRAMLALPDAPLVRDTLPDFTGDVGYGLVMAADTTEEWVAFWNTEVNRVMNTPAFRQRMEALLWVPANGRIAAYREEIARDRSVWGEVIRAASIRAGG